MELKYESTILKSLRRMSIPVYNLLKTNKKKRFSPTDYNKIATKQQ